MKAVPEHPFDSFGRASEAAASDPTEDGHHDSSDCDGYAYDSSSSRFVSGECLMCELLPEHCNRMTKHLTWIGQMRAWV